MSGPFPFASATVPSASSAVSAPERPVSAYTYGPQAARNPDLEVLLTDGLGGFALSSLAGVPTRCYSGLVVSQVPPVQRFTHFVSPLERLSVDGQVFDLHALEIAPGVFEGRGLDLLTGATVWDLLPEREQLVAGVRIRRRTCMPAGSGAVVYLYDLASREPVTLTLGGFFVDRDVHATHREPPNLQFELGGREMHVQGAHLTRATVYAPGGIIDALAPQPYPQRVYYRHDAARGEPDTEVTLGSALWEVQLPAGGGRIAVVVQGITQASAPIPDPWQAYDLEATRRRKLARLAQATTGVQDELVATLAVAADAYLVQRQAAGGGQEPAGVSLIAGYPWFADWGRDAMISLTGLTLLTGRHTEARELLRTYLAAARKGLIPNHFHENGQGAGFNTVDASLWLAVALERYVSVTGDKAFAAEALPMLRDLLGWHIRGTDYGIGVDDRDGLLRSGVAGAQLTWMDVKIHDWVVTPRHGKPIEIQGLWLAALGAEARLSDLLAEHPQFVDGLGRARASFPLFWRTGTTSTGQQVGRFMDVIAPDGKPDGSLRPNALLALALPDTPTTPAQVDHALRDAERWLLTPVGLHTLAPNDPRYKGNYGGTQLQRDAAYHQGTVWPWPIGAYVELLLSRGEVRRARAALAGLTGHVWEAGIGHVSEVFAGDSLLPGGCPFQAWSVAEFLRAHVLVSLAEAQSMRPEPAPAPSSSVPGTFPMMTQKLP